MSRHETDAHTRRGSVSFTQNDQMQKPETLLKFKFLLFASFYYCLSSFGPSFWPEMLLVNTAFWRPFLAISWIYQCILMYFSLIFRAFEYYWETKIQYNKAISLSRAKQRRTAIQLRGDAASKLTGFIHSVIASGLAIYITFNPTLNVHRDHLFGHSLISQIHGIHTAAVFFTEITDMIYTWKLQSTMEVVMLVHHFCGLLAATAAAYGLGTYYISIFLLLEISTPFLHLRWFLLTFGYGHTKRFQVIQYCFVTLFFLVRIVYAYCFITPIFVSELYDVACGALDRNVFPLWNGQNKDIAISIARICLTLMMVYHCINAYFFRQILHAVFRNPKKNE
jgi:hypothetical protein